jgi:hypothetical protein
MTARGRKLTKNWVMGQFVLGRLRKTFGVRRLDAALTGSIQG